MRTPIGIVTAVLGFAAAQALAQTPEVAKHSCEPRPSYPGTKAMKSEGDVKAFESKMQDYKKCIVTYIEARKASVKAHEAANNAAASEYNDTVSKIRADQEAALKESEAARKAEAKDNVTRPGAPPPKN